MLVYKYTSSYAGKLIIENGSLRFSQIEVLNDPFEIKPSFNSLKKTAKEFYRGTFEMSDDFKRMSYIEREAQIQKTVQPYIDSMGEILNQFLVLSLTKKEENLLMWSHYADSYRGLVIGFDYDNPFFRQPANSGISIPFKVKYSDKRPAVFDYFKIHARDVSEGEIKSLFLTKSLWWEYEEEIRMFTQPQTATNTGKDARDFDIYLIDFPKECLKRIIFGNLMESKEKKEISEIAKRLYPHAEILEAVQSETEFALKFKPYKT